MKKGTRKKTIEIPVEVPGEERRPTLLTKNWREYLKKYEINTNNFNSETFMIIESSPRCFPVTDALDLKMDRIDQSRVRSITQERLEKLANGEVPTKNLGEVGIMMKKAESEAKNEMFEKNILSTQFTALLIKLQILIIRSRYLSHKENSYELQKSLEEEQKIFLKIEDENAKKGANGTKAPKPKENPKKVKGVDVKQEGPNCDALNQLVSTPSVEIKKRMAALNQSENFIEPFEGVDLYFAILKVYDYDLLNELNNIGVNLTAVIDFAKHATKFSTEFYHITPFECSSQDQVRHINISNFWRACGLHTGIKIYTFPPTTCYLRYCPKIKERFPGDIDEVYHDLVRIAYNITALKRLHRNYLDGINVLDVGMKEAPKKLRQMKVYEKILDRIPNEFQSVPVILHALLEEIASRIPGQDEEMKYELDHDPPPKLIKRHDGAREQVKKLFKQFRIVHRPLKNLNTKVTVYKTKIIQYGNVLDYQLSHVPYGEDLKAINLDALKGIEPLRLFDLHPPIQHERELVYNHSLYKWAKNFEYTSVNRLKHCINAYYLAHGKFFQTPVFLDVPKHTVSDLFFSNYKPYNQNFENTPTVYSNYLLSSYTSDLTKRTKFKAAEIQRELFYCEHIEEYNIETMIQIVNVAYNNLKNFKYKFLNAQDTILIRFRQISPEVQHQYYSIRTPVCFRDFCGYVVDSEVDWLYGEEFEYWKKKLKERGSKQGASIEDVYVFEEGDFIRPGSIKDRLLKEKEAEEATLAKKVKKASKTEPGKGKVKERSKSKKDVTVQKDEQSENACIEDKPKVYEGYNLGDAYFLLRCFDIEYQSADGIKVSVEKWQFIDDSETCSIKINVNDNFLLFHTAIKESLMEMKPLMFQLHISNETIMTFSPPRLPKHVQFPWEKCLAMYEYKRPVRREYLKDFLYTQSKNPEEALNDMTTSKHKLIKRDVLRKISEVVENQIPIFKICSSPLHKRRYVKRIKSYIEIPVGKVLKRLTYKPRRPKRLKRQFVVPPQSEPYDQHHTLDFDFKSTLPTGLCIHVVQGTKEQPFYIRQGYVNDRKDLELIDYEDHRCFLKGKVVSFLKTGEVITMSLDRVLEKRQYGVTSLNLSEAMLKRDETARNKSSHSLKIHKATKDISRMEKKIKHICKKRERHMIDFSWNYRLESRRECLWRKRRRCKLPKQLSQMVPGYFPLLKLTMITEDGSKVVTDMRNTFEEKNKYFTTTYNDYLKGEILMYRQDGTSWFLSNDGKATTQFKDKTRITSWASLLNENYVFISDDFDEGDDLDALESSDFNKTYGYDNMDEGYGFWRSFSNNSSSLSENFEESEFVEEIEPFVVYGLNYKYEHPNYMTVTEFCTDGSTTIDMPDKVKVKISKDGSFAVTLQEEETMEVNKEIIKLSAKTCQECNSFTRLDVHIKPFYQPVPVKSQGTFLQLLDKHKKLIKIDFSGHLSEEQFKEDSVYSVCGCSKQLTDRYFVLKRDLSGAELFPRPTKPKFIHTKNFFPDNPEYSPTDENPISINFSLYKTYSEHLMMLYDIPLLGMTNNYLDSEELFRSFDYDDKCIIPLRTSIFTYERNISRLFLHKVLDNILSGVYAILHHGQPNKKYRPSHALIKFIKNHTLIVELPQKVLIQPPAPPPKKPYTSKFRTLKKAIEESKKLLDCPVPKFFDSLRGIVVGYIIECVSKAMDASERRQLEEQIRKNEKLKTKNIGHLRLPPSNDDFSESIVGLIDYSSSRSKSICIQDICDEVCKTKIRGKTDTKSEDEESGKQPVETLMPNFCTPSICPSTPPPAEISLHSFASTNNQNIIIEKNEKIIALDIIRAMIRSSAEKDLSDLSNTFIQSIVKEKTKDFNMTYENAVTIINEMETILFQNDEDDETVFQLAVNIINQVKDEIMNFRHIRSTDEELNVQLIEDLTVRGSIITYDALSTMSSARRLKAVQDITGMLQEANLSQGTATIVLDLIEQGLQEDLMGPQEQTQESLLDQISELASETALKIICNAEDIMVYQKIESPHTRNGHSGSKSFPSLGSGDFLYAGSPIGEKPIKRKHMQQPKPKNVEEVEAASLITLYPIIEESSSQPLEDKKKGGKRNIKRVKRRKQVSVKEEDRRYSMKNFQKKLFKEQSITKQPFHFVSSMDILEEESLKIPLTIRPRKSDVHRFAERKRLLD